MSRNRTMVVLGLVVAFAGAAHADEYELTGTLRDFSDMHSDFERPYSGDVSGVIQGMVKDKLGEAGKPVLNIGEVACRKIHVESTKDISNVVLELSDGTEFKYDDLNVGTESDFVVPDAHAGKTIVGAWVKAGPNFSGDGPGYGEYIDGSHDSVDTFTESNESQSIIVTFMFEDYIPPEWRIEAEETFNQWFRNRDGVNQSVPHKIVLSNGLNKPGGMYRFERTGDDSFFPADNRLYGNEGRPHNYHFTYEIEATFRYTDPAKRAANDDAADDQLVLNFSGDDDVWVFINGRLAVDLGGVHSEQFGTVNLDAKADELGLVPGEEYEFKFFFSERHTTGSNFILETNFPFLPSSYD